MIRILVLSKTILPVALRNLLEKADELKAVQQLPAEIVLLCCAVWNRTALTQLNNLRKGGSIPVAVLCEKTEEPFATESLMRGDISGLISKDSPEQQMFECFRAVAAGLRVFQNFPTTINSTSAVLTPREMEILRLISDGEGNKSIAYLLDISQHTVKFHIASIFEKLHVSSRTEAIRAGIKQGLLSI